MQLRIAARSTTARIKKIFTIFLFAFLLISQIGNIPYIPHILPTNSAQALNPQIPYTSIQGRRVPNITVINNGNGGRVDWSPDGTKILYDSTNSGSYYNLYTMNTDGTGSTCITCAQQGVVNTGSGDIGNGAYSPNGSYIAYQVQNTSLTSTGSQGAPGNGINDDIYIMNANGTNPVKITSVTQGQAVLHPQFSPDGTKITWAQKLNSNGLSSQGTWEIVIGSFSQSTGAVTNLQTYQPVSTAGYYETSGFTHDSSSVIFSATTTSQSSTGMDIYTYNFTSGVLTQLTNSLYTLDEHAHENGTGTTIDYVSGQGLNENQSPSAQIQGTELWKISPGGLNKAQLTYFNDPTSPEYIPSSSGAVIGDNAWSPDGTKIVANIQVRFNGTTPGSSIVIITLDKTAPSTPSSVTTTATAPNSVTVNWIASSDNISVAGYYVLRNGVLLGNVTSGTSYIDTLAKPNTSYTYSVEAYDPSLNISPASTTSSVTTPADTTAPTTVTNLSVVAETPSNIALSWTDATDNVGITQYNIYRNGTLLPYGSGATATTFIDTGLTPATTYSYYITAQDAAGNIASNSNTVSGTTSPSGSDNTAPTVPTGVTATASGPVTVNLTWVSSTDNKGVVGYRVYRANAFIATSTTNSYTDTTAIAGSANSYRVAAYDAAANTSAYSAPPVSVTTPADTTPPAMVTNVTATANSETSVTANWSATTDDVGVTGYEIFRNAAVLTTVSSSTLSFTDTGLKPGSSYAYTIEAYDAAGNYSTPPQEILGTTNADTQNPTTPTNLTGTAASSTVINLNWNASSDDNSVIGYNIYRSGAYYDISYTNSYSDTGLTPNTNYVYTVVALDGSGNHSGSSNSASVTTPPSADTQAPTIPTGLTATAASATVVNLSWTASSDNVGVTGYKIYRNGSSTPLGTSTTATYSDTTTTASTTYTYQVSAYDAAGNNSAESTPPVSVTTPAVADTQAPTIPTGLTATAASATVVNLSWTASSDNVGVTGYKIYRNGSSTPLGTSATTSYSDTTAVSNTTYTYQVSAYDAAGNNSAESTPPVSVTTPHSSGTASVPTGVTALGASQSSIVVGWSAGTGGTTAASYNVYRDGANIKNTTSLTYTDTGLATASTHTYTITAVDTSGNESAQSASATSTTDDINNVPAEYQDLYPAIKTNLDNFQNNTLTPGYSGTKYNTAFGAELFTADNTQTGILNAPSTYYNNYVVPLLKAYQAMGVKSVKVQIHFPIPYLPYMQSSCYTPVTGSATSDYNTYQTFYTAVGAGVAQYGMKLVVQSQDLPPNNGTVSGYGCYYAQLSDSQYELGRQTELTNLATWMNPQYVEIQSEPTNEYGYTNKSDFSNPTFNASNLLQPIITALNGLSNRSTFQIGAGIGTWQANESSWVTADMGMSPGLDYFGIHLYSVNNTTAGTGNNQGDLLGKLKTISDQVRAITPNFPLAMSEAWLHKVRDSELCIGGAGSCPSSSLIYSRDVYDFWAPLDQEFISEVFQFSAWYQLKFIDFSYPLYFFNYYNYHTLPVVGCVQPWDVNNSCTSAAVVNGAYQNSDSNVNTLSPTFTSTGTAYKQDIVNYSPAAPVITNISESNITTTGATITWTTDQASSSQVNYGTTSLYGNSSTLNNTQVTSHSVTLSGLSANTLYHFQVISTNTTTNTTGTSSDMTFSTISGADTQAPTIPNNVTATALSSVSIRVNWNASSDNTAVTGYIVFRGGGQIGTVNGTTLTYTDSGLTPNTSYSYTVLAYDAAGNQSAQSTAATATTQQDTTAPSVPTGVTATATGLSTVTVAWTASNDNVGVTGYKIFRGGNQIGSSSTTSYSDAGLTPNTLYSYTVLAYDAAGNQSAQSTAATVTTQPDTTAPSVPSNVTATATGLSTVTVAWTASNDNVGVTGYKIFRGGVQIGTSSSTSYSDSGLTANTQYTYTVLAYDAAGNQSAQSSAVMATTQSDTTPPSVPSNLTATATGLTTVTVAWTTSSDNVGVAGYKVFRGGVQIGTVNSPNVNYMDTGLTPNTLYSYTVLAYDAAGNSSGQTSAVTVTTQSDTTPPSVPSNVTATAASPTTTTVNWSASSDNVAVTGYKIFRGGTQVGSVNSPNLTFADSGLLPSTAYTYTVLAYDAAGNQSAQSIAANVTTQSDTTAPSVPTGVTATATGLTTMNVTWTASTDNVGVTGYRIFRAGSQIATTTTTTYADTGLTPNTSYSYTVLAYDAAGNASAQSIAGIGTTQPDTTAPSVPNNVTATAVSPTVISVSWNASSDNIAVTGYKIFRGGTQVGSVNAPSLTFADSGLTPSTLYSYTVAAYDGSGNNSAQSTAATATTTSGADVTPPTAPTGVTANATSATTISISWTASTDNVGVTGYNIFRNGTQIGNSATTSYSDTGLQPSTLYSYTVTAYDAAGNISQQSTAATATTQADTTPPSAPTNVTATAISSSAITIGWTASTDNIGVTGYKIFRGGSQVGSVAYPTVTYTDTGLSPSTLYSYTVLAFDSVGNQSTQSSAATATTQADTTPPSVPTNVTATATSATAITIAWTASTDNVGVAGYKIFRAGNQIGTSVTTTYSDTGLTPNTLYSYTVLAYDAPGNQSTQSSAATATTQADTTPPSVPLGVTATATGLTTITVSWTASSDNVAVGGYKIFRAGNQIGTSVTTTYSDSGLTPNTSYSYRIEAYDTATPSPNVSNASAIASAVTQADTSAPSVPTGVTASATGLNTVTVSWTASTDNVAVEGYRIFRGANQIGTTIAPAVTYNDTGLTPGTQYSYTVEAYDTAVPTPNVSAASTAALVTTQLDTTPPSIPQALTTVSSSPTSVTVSWTASTDNVAVGGYTIFRNGTQVGSVNAPIVTFTDTGLMPATVYSYTVKAYDTATPTPNISASSSTSTVTTQFDITPPTTPTNLLVVSAGSTSATVTWGASTDDVGVVSYIVYRNGSSIAIVAFPNLVYNDTGLVPSTTYQYAIVAVDGAGNTSQPTSNFIFTNSNGSDTIPPSQPTDLGVSSVTSTTVTLTWTASTDNVSVAGYNIYRNTVLVGTSATTSFIDTALLPSTTYSYTVSAYDPTGNISIVSTAVSATTTAISLGGGGGGGGGIGGGGTLPVPTPISTPTPTPITVPVSIPVVTNVVFPAHVSFGNVVLFIGNSIIYLVESDGLHPFTEYPGYQTYIASSKQTLMHLSVNANGVTIVSESAESYLGMQSNQTPSTPVSTTAYVNNTIVNDHGTIYLIEETTKIPFTSIQVFNGLGYSLKNAVVGSTAGYTQPSGYVLSNANQRHSWGSWVRDGSTIYYVSPSGFIGVPSYSLFLKYGLTSNAIVTANTTDLGYIDNSHAIPVLTYGDPRLSF